MNTTTSKLRLGPLPKTETTKVTFTCTTALRTTLDRYAALHAQVHGKTVDAITLIPHMLEAFMVRDRVFQRLNKSPAHPGVKSDTGLRHSTPT